MAKANDHAQRQDIGWKAIIDHFADEMYEPRSADRDEPVVHSATTSTGLPVEGQVRKATEFHEYQGDEQREDRFWS
jgi:hypothetical protein